MLRTARFWGMPPHWCSTLPEDELVDALALLEVELELARRHRESKR